MSTGVRCRGKDRSRLQSRSLLRTNNIGRRSSWNRTSIASSSKHKEYDDNQSSKTISDYAEEKAHRSLKRRSCVRTRDSLPRVEYPLVDSASRGYKFILWKRRRGSSQRGGIDRKGSVGTWTGCSLTSLVALFLGLVTFPVVKAVSLMFGMLESIFMLIFHPIRSYRQLRFGNDRAFRCHKCEDDYCSQRQ